MGSREVIAAEVFPGRGANVPVATRGTGPTGCRRVRGRGRALRRGGILAPGLASARTAGDQPERWCLLWSSARSLVARQNQVVFGGSAFDSFFGGFQLLQRATPVKGSERAREQRSADESPVPAHVGAVPKAPLSFRSQDLFLSSPPPRG